MKKLFFAFFLLSFQLACGQIKPVTNCLGCIPFVKNAQGGITLTVTNSATGQTFTGQLPVNVPAGYRLSVGIYSTSGVLLRTLRTGEPLTISNQIYWDGKDDKGNILVAGTYTCKVLTNNVQYAWDGVVGNSSDSFVGDHIYTGFSGPFAFAFSSTQGFLGDRFAEGVVTATNFQLSDTGNPSLVTGGLSIVNTAMATDGTNIYYAGYDDYQAGQNLPRLNLIYATKISDGSRVSFSSGSTHLIGRDNTSATVTGTYTGGNSNTNAGNYSGLAVNSNYLFASVAGNNTLYVIDKVTGATVQTVNLTSPGSLACTKDGTKLWIAFPSSVKLYTINTDGTLTDTGTSVAASSNVSIACSPTINELAVADSATNQVKFYGSLSGSYNSTFGQAGGYNGSPLVTYDKFQFLDKKHFIYSPRIAYLPDGGFALNDAGNYRLLIFNADRSYRNQVTFVRSSRSANADPNNPTRVFADVLEYQVDYSKTLDNGTNGSWKLKYNWNVSDHLDIYGQFEQVVTLLNGHTYAIGSNKLYDLRSDVGAVLLGSFDGNMMLEADGSLYERQWDNTHGATIIKHLLTGFDSNNKPSWDTGTQLVKTPDVGNDNPAYYVNNVKGSATNSNFYFFFNPNYNLYFNQYVLGNTYHLGGIKTGGTTYSWLASNSTIPEYVGDYPRNGDFDIGNGNQHSENGKLFINATNLFWHVNAEFWQTNSGATNGVNIWQHFNEDGLFIGSFGVTALQAKTFLQNAGNAGNSFSGALVKVGNDYYIYHCDESQHGGVHRWHVTGLNTIQETSFPITITAAIPAYSDPADLMAGLPYRSDFAGGHGWSFNRTPDANFFAHTSVLTYRKSNIDLAVTGKSNSESFVLRSLGTNNTNNWSLSGKVAWMYAKSYASYDGVSYDVLDVNGKILAHLDVIVDTGNGYLQSVKVNGITLQSGYEYLYPQYFVKYLLPFSMTNVNGQVTFSYAGYSAVLNAPFESGGDFTKPANFKIRVFSGGAQQSVSELRFTTSANGIAQ